MSTSSSPRENRRALAPGQALGQLSAICALVFVLVLALAAYFDASIRVLHSLEAVPYVVAAVLCWRASKQGFALGVASGVLWFWMGAFGTTFVLNGLQQTANWIHTGRLERPDLLIAVPAAASTLGLVLFSIAAYARLSDKAWTDIGLLALYTLLVLSFFMAIFAIFAPGYLGVFGIHARA